MPRSMTGYGRARGLDDGREIVVEIRAVNHRYYEFSARLPKGLLFLEEKLKALLSEEISRGKVEISVTVTRPESAGMEVSANTELALAYLSALRGMNERLGLNDNLELSDILRLPDVLTVTKEPEDEEAVTQAVLKVAREALDSFLEMRRAEGAKLVEDLAGKISALEVMRGRVAQLEPESTENYRQRLLAKLQELLGERDIDEQRILTETAIFADKIAVDEETVRLKSHLEQFGSLLESGGAVGRKLDFLVQEMNREVNTIGSKAQNLEITKLVVDMKAEIEKIREQIQNIE